MLTSVAVDAHDIHVFCGFVVCVTLLRKIHVLATSPPPLTFVFPLDMSGVRASAVMDPRLDDLLSHERLHAPLLTHKAFLYLDVDCDNLISGKDVWLFLFPCTLWVYANAGRNVNMHMDGGGLLCSFELVSNR